VAAGKGRNGGNKKAISVPFDHNFKLARNK
jgi:hypothetical protein